MAPPSGIFLAEAVFKTSSASLKANVLTIGPHKSLLCHCMLIVPPQRTTEKQVNGQQHNISEDIPLRNGHVSNLLTFGWMDGWVEGFYFLFSHW